MTTEPLRQTVRLQLPASLLAPRQARAAIRKALTAWGLRALAEDAELAASELVANAAEHGNGEPIGLAISAHTEPGGQAGVLCQVTDTAPACPSPGTASPTVNAAAACTSSTP
jgi:anti-sigma regulatory factor (Ser/Thr protein kinase)